MKVQVKGKKSGKEIVEPLKALAKLDVLVGVPYDGEREEDGISNAELGRIHEDGSPANNLPDRPHLIPGVKNAEEKTAQYFKAAVNKALDNDLTGAKHELVKAGMNADQEVKQIIQSGELAPLAMSTLEKGANKGRQSDEAEMVGRVAGMNPNTFRKPLILTQEYLKSITSVLREK